LRRINRNGEAAKAAVLFRLAFRAAGASDNARLVSCARSQRGFDVVRLVMTWDIQSGKEQDYVEFAVSEFGPTMVRLGLQITDVWYTMAGEGPQIVVAGNMESADEVEKLLATEEFGELREKLLQYVEELKWRVTRPRQGPSL
jgi:hypothetical protein